MANPVGECWLCGNRAPLSFEHIPPEAAFNDRPVVLAAWQDFESGYGSEYVREGRGGHTLCERCNNRTGGSYGPAFVEWCYHGFNLLSHTQGKASQNFHGEIYPLRVVKEIATIFFSVCGPEFRTVNQTLVEFVLNERRTGLPPDYGFHVFWYGGGVLRQAGVTGVINVETSKQSFFAEFIHPPFGYILNLGGVLPDKRPCSISDFAGYDYDDCRTINRRFPVLETNWKCPGDYRTLEEIERDKAINDIAAAGHPEPKLEWERRRGS
jgi:hypothetical protein